MKSNLLERKSTHPWWMEDTSFQPWGGLQNFGITAIGNKTLHCTLTHWLLELFAKNAFFGGTFWSFAAWIWAKLVPIYSKRFLQHDSMSLFPLTLHFQNVFWGMCSSWPSSGLDASLKLSEKALLRWAIFTMEQSVKLRFITYKFLIIVCAYFRLHSDLGINGKNFSSCRSWVYMMPMLVKGDRANSHYGQLQVGTGVNGLSLSNIIIL